MYTLVMTDGCEIIPPVSDLIGLIEEAMSARVESESSGLSL